MNEELIVLNSDNQLNAFQSDWNYLLSQSGFDTVFLTHQWITTLFNCFHKDKLLNIFLLKLNGDLAGIAPLQSGKSKLRGLPVREISFIENDEVPRFDFIVRQDYSQKDFIKFILNNLLLNSPEPWDIIKLRNVPETSRTIAMMHDFLGGYHFKYITKRSLNSPFIMIDRTWDDYLKLKGQHFRKRMRNTLNRIEKRGAISIVHITSADAFAKYLPHIKKISDKSWLHHEGRDIFGDMRIKNFFIEFSKIAAEAGWLSIWLLLLNDDAIAFEYHLIYGNSVHALRASYDLDYGDFSPGSVLEYNIIKAHFEDYTGTPLYYDLCGGKDFYKTRWTDDVKSHYNITIFNRTPYSFFLYHLENSFIPLAKTIYSRTITHPEHDKVNSVL
jgi:hypothetical protein